MTTKNVVPVWCPNEAQAKVLSVEDMPKTSQGTRISHEKYYNAAPLDSASKVVADHLT